MGAGLSSQPPVSEIVVGWSPRTGKRLAIIAMILNSKGPIRLVQAPGGLRAWPGARSGFVFSVLNRPVLCHGFAEFGQDATRALGVNKRNPRVVRAGPWRIIDHAHAALLELGDA